VGEPFDTFQRIARKAHRFSDAGGIEEAALHPFDRRNIHPGLPKKARKLFDDGHYAEAAFHAWKFIDKVVARHSGLAKNGWELMMAAFNDSNPKIKLNALSTVSDMDEQKGYQFLFGGSVCAIRNPRGHEVELPDDIDTCLDHLAFASMLLRRLERAGYA
jgi:uncharacterized protein (TIGR02391 family)